MEAEQAERAVSQEYREGPSGQIGRIPSNPAGTLIVIGGNENKEGHRPILEELAKRVGDGKLVIATLASEEPDEQWEE
jgi:cyanophycinase